MYVWIEKLKMRHTTVSHEEGAQSLSTPSTDENFQQFREVVMANWRVIIDELVCTMQNWVTTLCSSKAHMFTMQEQQENWLDQAQTLIN